MTITIVPRRLFAIPLPTGGHEVSCYVRFAPEDVNGLDALAWSVADDIGEMIVTGLSRLETPQREAGRVFVAAVIPPGWATVRLTVAGSDAFVAWPIEHYMQLGAYGLPFAGMALVVGGHRVGEVHRAAWDISSQQFGWDFLPLGNETWSLLAGSPEAGLPASLFAAFGRQVIAPAAGRVVRAVDGQPDHEIVGMYPDREPFLADLASALGNGVILDHGDGVYSALGHLRCGTVRVQVGDTVAAGQVLGEVGNSGFSAGPHLHLHFMDGPDLLSASPLPVQLDFEDDRRAPQAGEIIGE
jgi:hypothetical protein